MPDPQLDQGWSWVVGFASMMVHMLITPIFYAYGVFLQPWMIKFNINSAVASSIGATSSGLVSLSAPISSYCISRWGCRFTVILGGLLATIGLIIASCAQSFAVLLASFGILSGFGLGLTYVAAIVVLSEYFDKKRGIALGIASSGAGVGSFIFPLILEWLMDKYGVEDSLLILASLVFHDCLCGMVMFPVRNKKSKEKSDYIRTTSQVDLENLTQHSKYLSQDEDLTNNHDNVNFNEKSSNWQKKESKKSFLIHPWLRRKPSLFPLGTTTRDNFTDIDQVLEVETGNNSKIANIPPSDSILPPQSTFATQSRVILRHPLFYVMVVSNLTMYINMMMTYCLIPICAVTEHGFTKNESSFFLSAIGLTTLLGRFGWGMLITLIPRIKPFSLFVALRVLASVLTFLSPIANTFALQTTYCSLVGLCFGCLSIYPVVVSNTFGDGCLNVAFGYLEPFNGIGSIIGPILGGYLLDATGSSKTPFAVSAAIQAGGILTTALIYKAYYSRVSNNTTLRNSKNKFPKK